ncbi:MAG: YncE family protein [Candidatus Omnitrophica bacterium]|nr:YncE family protein [Candidatus Omnitrophota bacterium]
MKKTIFYFLSLFLILLNPAYADHHTTLTLKKKILLPDLKGRIDHLAIDLKGERLFVPVLGNNALEIIDLKSGKSIHTIKGLSEPQGVIFVSESNKIYVSNAGNGECNIFDANSFSLIKTIEFGEDADNMRYDPATRHIYIGYGSGGIGIVDSVNDKRLGDILLSAHPEAFEFETQGTRIFINIPSSREIIVADYKKTGVENHWQLKNTSENFPMALDEANQRLFIGCRNPEKLLVLDTLSGKVTYELALDSDADDIFYDAKNKRLFISCGEGFIDVIEQKGPSDYVVAERIPTIQGARTSLFVPESGYYYLAVPAHESQEAEIQIYKINQKQ